MMARSKAETRAVSKQVGDLDAVRERGGAVTYRVAVNHALNRSSEVARHARIHEKIGKDGKGDPGGTKEGRPVDDEVHRALQQLSPKLRTVISLRYLEGLSYEEIAEILEISIGTVKSRLFLAHETLRPLLKGVKLEGDA